MLHIFAIRLLPLLPAGNLTLPGPPTLSSRQVGTLNTPFNVHTAY